MVRFLMMESTHLNSNFRFNIGIVYLQLIILSVEYDVPVNSETFLITDFINLKIKPTQSFNGAHRGGTTTQVIWLEVSLGKIGKRNKYYQF
jgi:hypothetical protein